MARDEEVYEVDRRPLTVRQLQKMENPDCLPCAIVGTGAFIGLGVYTLMSGTKQINANAEMIRASGSRWGVGPRKAGVHLISMGLISVGVIRFWWWRKHS